MHPLVLFRSAYVVILVIMAFVSTVIFTDEIKAKFQPLEPAFENLLRSSNVHEDVINALRMEEISDREMFISLDPTEEGLAKSARDAFGIDPDQNFAHKKELAKLKKTWSQAKLQSEAKQKVDAVARAHGEPITMLACDWVSSKNQFKSKYGMQIHETRLPAQSYFEAYEEKLQDGLLYPETLAQVISLAEENKQKSLKPEMSRQMGLHLDNTLTIQTKRRFISSMPATIEELRNKYQVMTHMWLLAQMRQPTRLIYSDLKESTFTKLVDELLSEKNFLPEREIAGCKMVVPEWAHCLEYEFQTRKEALRLVREEGPSIEKALWAAYQNPHHRIEHWLTLLSNANSGVTKSSSSSSSSNPADQRLQKIERKFAELERSLQRSRSPRVKFSAVAAPQTQLALPSQHHPQPRVRANARKEKMVKARVKPIKVQGQHFPQRLIRSLRTRSTTDSSFTRRPTRRVFATISQGAMHSKSLPCFSRSCVLGMRQTQCSVRVLSLH